MDTITRNELNLPTSVTIVVIIIAILLMLIADLVVDIGPGIIQHGHDDPITTPLPGNRGCDYPGCAGGTVQITLEPTIFLTHLPTYPNPATPDIPDPTQFPTVFPTFHVPVDLIPTPISTRVLPTINPTAVPVGLPPTPVFSL